MVHLFSCCITLFEGDGKLTFVQGSQTKAMEYSVYTKTNKIAVSY